MRKPRDYDAELRALDEKVKLLRQRKVAQLGELVVTTGADALSIEELTGTLLAAVSTTDFVMKEERRERGAAFFRRPLRSVAGGTRRQSGGAAARNLSSPSAPGDTSAA